MGNTNQMLDLRKTIRIDGKRFEKLERIVTKNKFGSISDAIRVMIDIWDGNMEPVPNTEEINIETAEHNTCFMFTIPDGIPVLDTHGMNPVDIMKFSFMTIYFLRSEFEKCLSHESGILEQLKNWEYDYIKLCSPDKYDTSQIDRAIFSQYVQYSEEVANNHRLNILPLAYMIQVLMTKIRRQPGFKEEHFKKLNSKILEHRCEFESAVNGVTIFYRSREAITNAFRKSATSKTELMEILMNHRNEYYDEINRKVGAMVMK